MLYYVSVFYFFLLPNNIPLYEYSTFYEFIHQLMEFGLFPLFGYDEWCCYEHLYITFCGHKYLGVELLGHMVSLLSILRNCQTVSQSDCSIWHTSNVQGFHFSAPLSTLAIIYFLIIVILVCEKWHLIVVLVCISLMANMNIFSCDYWPFVCLPWRNVYSDALPTFSLCCVFIEL